MKYGLLAKKVERVKCAAVILVYTRGVRKMDERIMAVQQMQEYIEAHLNEVITLSALSGVSSYSPWYSYRLFKEYTGRSPADYIRRLRLSKSAMRLRKQDTKIIDIAFGLGFGSVDGYTRAFYREFGCNPSEYAKNSVPISLFVPYGVKFKYIKENRTMDVKSVFVQVVKKPNRKVIIKRGKCADNYWDYCQEVGCDVWGLLLSMDSLGGEPVCLWLPDRYKTPDSSTYVQGVEVPYDYSGIIPDGFDVMDLPAAEYLMFQGEPFEEECFGEAIAAVQQAMDRYRPQTIGYVWDNGNPRIQLEPKGERGYIELRAVVKR